METPKTVPEHLVSTYEATNELRKHIKEVAKLAAALRQAPFVTGEVAANSTLAYRHLEDASMRLGKVLQHLDGGVSVYDKATTVGV